MHEMTAALGLGKLGKHIKEIPKLSVKDLWGQSESPVAASFDLIPSLAIEAEEPLSQPSLRVRHEAKTPVLQVGRPGAKKQSLNFNHRPWSA